MQATAEKPKRKPLPDHLARVDIQVDVSAEDKQMMGDDWVHIGFETSEQLAVNQRQYFVKRICRAKYIRKSSGNEAQARNADTDSRIGSDIKVAPPAPVILPKSIADASLLADVLCSKFIDAMSFYRTHARLERDGIDIGYSTLCDWPIQLHQRLSRFETLFYEAIGRQSLWHLDETTLQVLDEVGRANQLTSYLWSIRAGPPEQPIVLFHYHERRNYAALEEWLRPSLATFNGVIVTDEHAPYNMLVKTHPNIVAHGGCLAHCRRKFVDAAKGRRDNGDTQKIIRMIAGVYSQENKLAHLSGQDRAEARQSTVKPLMDKLKFLLDQLEPKYTHKNAMGTAIGYALNNWLKFTAFLDHGELPIDNNAMERAIRPFTLGRKNWIFAGSPRGARASAFIYSLIESAKANGLEPLRYLTNLFEAYPLAKSDDQRRQLLPWNFKNKE
jgi:transposase